MVTRKMILINMKNKLIKWNKYKMYSKRKFKDWKSLLLLEILRIIHKIVLIRILIIISLLKESIKDTKNAHKLFSQIGNSKLKINLNF